MTLQLWPNTSQIYPNVEIGKDAEIGDFVIIGLPPKGTDSGELKTVIGCNAVIRSHTVIYAGNTIGDDFQTGHATMIRESNRIGNKVSLGTHSVVEHHVNIDDGVRIHSQAFIPEYSTLEQGCWIGPNVVFTNSLYPLSANAKKNLKGPHICQNAKIGANSTLLPGVVIGQNALVGAGSVVVKDVSSSKVVVGNPARVIKNVSDLDVYLMNENDG